MLNDGIRIQHAAIAEDINGVAAGDRMDQMLAEYARTLQDAGFNVTRPAPGNLAVAPEPADRGAGHRPPPGNREHDNLMQANRATAAANVAYRAGDFDQARQLTDQAASL
ncbi:MAG TPA: hypothetical protein VGJ54_10910, partial [Streptosporangiaceae bacterium]